MFHFFKKYYQKLNTFSKIFLLFIIIMLLLIIPTFIVSNYANNIIINKQIEVNKNYSTSVTKYTDNIFLSIVNSCYNITGTDSYDNYIKYFKQYDNDFPIYTIKLKKSIKNITTNNPYINDIIIYSKTDSGEYLISAQGTYDAETYFDKINIKKDYPYDFWRDMVKEQFSLKFLPSSASLSSNGEKKSNILTMLIKKKYSNSPNTYMVVDVDEKVLFNLIQTINITKKGYVYIYDSEKSEFLNGTDLLNIKNHDNTKQINKYITEDKTSGNIKLNEKDYLISYEKSNINNLYYIVITPKNILTTEITKFQKISFFIIFLFIIIGLAISIFFTKAIYSPLGDMINYVKGLTGYSQEAENEYNYLRESFLKMNGFQQNSVFAVMNTLIYRAINCNLDLQEAEDLIKQYNLPLNKRYYSVINIRIYSNENFSDNEVDMSKELFQNSGQFKELFIYFGEVIQISSHIYVLFVNIDNGEELKNTLEQLERGICDYININNKLDIFIGISDMFEDITQSHNFYQQAYNILDMRNINSNKLVYDKDDRGSDVVNLYSKKEEMCLNNYLLNFNEKDTMVLLENIFKYCRSKNIAFIRYRETVNELIQIAFNVLSQKQVDLKTIFIDERELLLNINLIYKSDALEEACRDIYSRILNYLSSKENNYSTIKLILDYIDNNINTAYLNDVASKFNMNSNYLSQYFKKHTGDTFTNYININKIKAAKENLLNTNKTVEQISQELGFNSSSTFIRMFKQIEGLTPNSYREKQLCE